MMRAVQLTTPGPAKEVFKLADFPLPKLAIGQVLIRIKAFGLNHSELATRLDEKSPMPPVQLPRILGIEAVGVVEEAPGFEQQFPKCAKVMTALGGLGRMFDGSYAEYCCAPASCCILVPEDCGLGWDALAALPETLQTAHGSLFRALQLKAGGTLLVRGATSSVGLTAISLAKHAGCTVLATTRSASNQSVLQDAGADHVIVSTGPTIVKDVKTILPTGVNKVLDLVGTSTVMDSLQCLAESGICCSTGTLGGSWSLLNLVPNMALGFGGPKYLTGYGETTFKAENFRAGGAEVGELLKLVESGALKVKIGKVYRGLENVVEAHEVAHGA